MAVKKKNGGQKKNNKWQTQDTGTENLSDEGKTKSTNKIVITVEKQLFPYLSRKMIGSGWRERKKLLHWTW